MVSKISGNQPSYHADAIDHEQIIDRLSLAKTKDISSVRSDLRLIRYISLMKGF